MLCVENPVWEVVGLVTQPDRPVGRRQELRSSAVKQAWDELQASAGQPLPYFQPEKLRQSWQEIVAAVRPDLLVVVAYGQILPGALLEAVPLGGVNIHGSLLPSYRGATPIEAALRDGLTTTGVSVLQMTAGLDDGPVWAEQTTEIAAEEDAVSLRTRMSSLGAELLQARLPQIIARTDTPTDQTELATSTGRPLSHTHVKDLSFAAGELDIATASIDQLHNQVRAFAASGAWFYVMHNERKTVFKVWRSAIALRETQNGGWGKFKRIGAKLVIICRDGLLELSEVQLEGKQRRPSSDYLFLADDIPFNVRVAVIAEGKLLVIRRQKLGRHYLVLPGGHLKSGETFRAGAVRELFEETNVRTDEKTLKSIFSYYNNHTEERMKFFLLNIQGPTPPVKMEGEEMLRQTPDNTYELSWVELDSPELKKFRPQELRGRLLRQLRQQKKAAHPVDTAEAKPL